MRPDFGHIKYIPFVPLGLFRCHCLNIDIPFRVVSFGDCPIKIIDQVVRVFSGNPRCRFTIEALSAKLWLDVNLDVAECAVLSMSC